MADATFLGIQDNTIIAEQVAGRINQVNQMRVSWRLVEALLGGTQRMRDVSTLYLPNYARESEEDYKARLESTFLFGAFAYTVGSVAGRPFVDPVKINDSVPQVIAQNLEDVDREGRNIDMFAHDLFTMGVAYGHAFILVDYPIVDPALPGAIATQADVKIVAARPYMTLITPQQVLGWKAEIVEGAMQLTEVRIWEIMEEQAGPLFDMEILQVRIMRPDGYEIWRPMENVWTKISEGPHSLGRIPLVPFYAKRTGLMASKPPLLDLAYANLEHWQSSSEQRSILHAARVPIMTVATDDAEFTMNNDEKQAVRLPLNSKMEWVETKGASIAAGRQDLLDIEDRMRSLGSAITAPGDRGARSTATEAQIESNKDESQLGAMARSLEDCMNTALYIWAQWLGLSDGGTLEIYKNVADTAFGQNDEAVLTQAALAGKISDETLFTEFQRRGTINPDIKWADELARIESQGPTLPTATGAPISGDMTELGLMKTSVGVPGNSADPLNPDPNQQVVKASNGVS